MIDAQSLILLALLMPIMSAIVVQLARSDRTAHHLNIGFALVTGAAGTAAGIALAAGHAPHVGWMTTDRAAGVLIATTSLVAMASALVAPAYLRGAATSAGVDHTNFRTRVYYAAQYAFWTTLLVIPLVTNLAIAWILVEATTAASAVLVAIPGKPRALEAGWKYLVLTTLGLSIAFFGIVAMFVGSTTTNNELAALDWDRITRTAHGMSSPAALAAYVLILVGLAAKVGWAPVHNWLPDAHSEAPAPVSALLSASLLPTVALLAWRLRDAFHPVLGADAVTPLLAFGLLSVGIAAPFLWQAGAWKRMLAYSSLEHMGVIAVGIAFATPLALAGVALHVAGHAVAKSLGFFAAMPLFHAQPAATRQPPRGIASIAPRTWWAMMISLVTLAGLPPGPLFFSEVFILVGGLNAGYRWAPIVLLMALALAFVGLLRVALRATAERSSRSGAAAAAASADAAPSPPGDDDSGAVGTSIPIGTITIVAVALLTALSVCALWLPTSEFARALAGGAA